MIKPFQGVIHVGIFIGTILSFRFNEIFLRMRLGPHGKVYGLCWIVMGCHTHKDESNILINCLF
jgi:hypothetical protein